MPQIESKTLEAVAGLEIALVKEAALGAASFQLTLMLVR